MHVTTRLTATTTFDFREMATQRNNFDHTKVNPQNHTIHFLSDDHSEFEDLEIPLGTLYDFVRLIRKFPTQGKAFDALYKTLDVIEEEKKTNG